MIRYLADSSIWITAQRGRAPHLPQLLTHRLERDEIAVCVPVALEVLVGARDTAEYEEEWRESWERLQWLPLTGRVAERALAVMASLAHTTVGAHRLRPMDYLIAACAEAAGKEVVLWHWDNDLTAICEHTGQPHEPEHERARADGLGPPDELSEGSGPWTGP